MHTFLEFIIGQGADLSLWGKRLSLKTSYAKRLPLHYAAENKRMKTDTVMMVAKAYPPALFEPVTGRPVWALDEVPARDCSFQQHCRRVAGKVKTLLKERGPWACHVRQHRDNVD